MNKIIGIFAVLSFIACHKPIEDRQQAASVTATIHKVSMLDSVELLINHLRPISPTDATTFTGTVSWGDGNTTTFTNPTLSYVSLTHKYFTLGIFPIKVTFNKPDAVTTFNLLFRPSIGGEGTDTLLSITGLNGVPYLISLILQNTKLQNLDITGNTHIERVWLGGNRLTNSSINSILMHMDSYTGANLTPSPEIHLNGQTPASPPSNGGITAKQSLLNKGCVVQTD